MRLPVLATALTLAFLYSVTPIPVLAKNPKMDGLLTESANGSAEANYQIGKIYWCGLWVPTDRAKAIPYFQKAASKGHSESALHISKAFKYGDGIEKNVKQAESWKNRSLELLGLNPEQFTEDSQADRALIDHGSPEILYTYGLWEQLGILDYLSPGFKKVADSWEGWIRKSAKLDHPQAKRTLGIALMQGKDSVAKNVREGEMWLRRSAEQGDLLGQAWLGRVYFEGMGGLPKNYYEAEKWLLIAAERGSTHAQINYGDLILSGFSSTEDLKDSISWFKKAAHQGNSTAQLKLGKTFMEGRIVPQDYIQAYAYLNLIHDSPEEELDATALLLTIETKMKPAEILEAQSLSQKIFDALPERPY